MSNPIKHSSLPIAVLLLAGCSGASHRREPAPPVSPQAVAPPSAIVAASPQTPVAAAIADEAATLGLASTGACLVVGLPDGAVHTSTDACADLRLRPASTFKIVNTLIAADLGLIRSADSILRYDPVRYPPEKIENPEWKRDQTVRKALEISAVPLYRHLAIEIGAERMQSHLDALGYGNRSIAGGLDSFWLSGKLAISAREQVAMITGLIADSLPVSAAATAIVREALQRETIGTATIHWKTGTGILDQQAGWIAWLVGWVDRPEGPHPFACWIHEAATVPLATVLVHRIAACRGALAKLGWIGLPPR
jgi:beta-lactamase class D